MNYVWLKYAKFALAAGSFMSPAVVTTCNLCFGAVLRAVSAFHRHSSVNYLVTITRVVKLVFDIYTEKLFIPLGQQLSNPSVHSISIADKVYHKLFTSNIDALILRHVYFSAASCWTTGRALLCFCYPVLATHCIKIAINIFAGSRKHESTTYAEGFA